jgi:hydroxypyruvate reductase
LLVPYTDAPSVALPDWLAGMVQAGLATAATTGTAPPLELVATLGDALEAAAERARAAGEHVHHHPGFLEGDAGEQGAALGDFLLGAPSGIHLWGGETTVRLPPDPGRGGRNQHLALALAGRIAGHGGLWCLAVGTDGTDGPTEDAGGLVDGGTWQRARDGGRDPEAALRAADSGTALEAAGDLVNTGPTGTNVMDLVIALKTPGGEA